jgi:MtaA/CmuA family methyltransferase
MKSLERIRKAIRGEPVDHLPAQPLLMMFAAKQAGIRYIDYTRDGRKMAEAQLKLAEDYPVDCLMTCSDPAREVIDIAGEGSVDWFVDQGPAINEERAALLDKSRLRKFRIPDPLGGGRMHDRIKAIEIMRKAAGPDMSIVGWVEGPLAFGAELRGLNAVMTDFVDDPDFVRALFDFTAEVAISYAPAQIAAGADTIAMSDAAASMIGPKLYAEFLWPAQRRVLQSIKTRFPHVLTRLHMCGRTDPLITQMRELPADVFELDFPVNLANARADLGSDKVILGNVSTITDLLEGTPEKVYEATARCHRTCGRFHVVGAGCEVSPLTPPENLRAMLEYAREHKP